MGWDRHGDNGPEFRSQQRFLRRHHRVGGGRSTGSSGRHAVAQHDCRRRPYQCDRIADNSAVASAGGFTYNCRFMWNGTDSTSFGHTEKIIDYAGTESLQLVTSSGSASLQMSFADDTGTETIPVSTTILPNTWYNVALAFNAMGNSLDGNGDISGVASMDG